MSAGRRRVCCCRSAFVSSTDTTGVVSEPSLRRRITRTARQAPHPSRRNVPPLSRNVPPTCAPRWARTLAYFPGRHPSIQRAAESEKRKKPEDSGIFRPCNWSRQQESNLHLALRRHSFYPLNYGEGRQIVGPATGAPSDHPAARASSCRPKSGPRSTLRPPPSMGWTSWPLARAQRLWGSRSSAAWRR